jgi:glycosyltransferase involved in cell wall biosynthesis
MQILYDYVIFGLQRFGGISRYFSEIIPRIAATGGCDVSVFMGLYINRYGLEKHRSAFRNFWGVRRPFIGKTHQISQKINQKLLARFARRVPVDVYHTTAMFEFPWETDRCRILTVHDMIQFQGFWPVSDSERERQLHGIQSADGVICVSESTKRDVIRIAGINPEKIAVIHHGAPTAIATAPDRPIAERYVLYVGMRGPYKNWPTLAEAFAKVSARFPDHRLVMFGGGALRAEESALLRKLGIENRITIIGGGDDELLATMYAHAEVMVYPSRYEGFGIPLLEAFTYRCPVIASNATSLPEVGDEAARYFNPQSVDELSDELTNVLGQRDLREDLAARGLQRLADFSWDRCATETVAFYEKTRFSRKGG